MRRRPSPSCTCTPREVTGDVDARVTGVRADVGAARLGGGGGPAQPADSELDDGGAGGERVGAERNGVLVADNGAGLGGDRRGIWVDVLGVWPRRDGGGGGGVFWGGGG